MASFLEWQLLSEASSVLVFFGVTQKRMQEVGPCSFWKMIDWWKIRVEYRWKFTHLKEENIFDAHVEEILHVIHRPAGKDDTCSCTTLPTRHSPLQHGHFPMVVTLSHIGLR